MKINSPFKKSIIVAKDYDLKVDLYISQWKKKEGNIRKVFEIHKFERVFLNTENKNFRVLDLGCGYGRFFFSSEHIFYENYFGIDLSFTLLKKGKQIDNSINLIKANAFSLPFKSKVFDGAVAIGLFESVDFPRLLISEVMKTLKRNGIFIFNVHNLLIHKPLNHIWKILNSSRVKPLWKSYYDPRKNRLRTIIGMPVKISYYYSLPIVIILKLFPDFFNKRYRFLNLLKRLDNILNKFPILRLFSSTIVLTLKKRDDIHN